MTPSHTTRNGRKRYRYYVCSSAQKRGWHTWPSKAIPAGAIERFVLEQIHGMAEDRVLRAEVLRQARVQFEAESAELEREWRGLERQLGALQAELQRLAADGAASDRLAEWHERVAQTETRLREVRHRIAEHDQQRLDAADIDAAFADFDNVWNALNPREQVQVVALLVARVEFDAADSTVTVTFHPTAIKTLARQRLGGAA